MQAPQGLRQRDKKAQFKKRTLEDLDRELAALRQEVESLKQANRTNPATPTTPSTPQTGAGQSERR